MGEHKTILGKIFGNLIEGILDLFKSNYESFLAKQYRKVPDEVKDKISIGIKIVEGIKNFVESPVSDFVTMIIPGDLDDKLAAYLRTLLPQILDRYKHLAGHDDYYSNVATSINSELTGLPRGQATITTEVVYKGLKSEGKL